MTTVADRFILPPTRRFSDFADGQGKKMIFLFTSVAALFSVPAISHFPRIIGRMCLVLGFVTSDTLAGLLLSPTLTSTPCSPAVALPSSPALFGGCGLMRMYRSVSARKGYRIPHTGIPLRRTEVLSRIPPNLTVPTLKIAKLIVCGQR